MNNLSALYFPETGIVNELTRDLLIFFETLSFYNITESSPQTDQKIFFDKKLCINRNPIALGDDLPRFQQLLHDLKGHENEYYGGYLSSLSAGFSQDRDEASVWQLVSRMMKGAAKSEIDNVETKIVWQAMLLLKLAEMLTQEEQEVSQGLRSIANQQEQLLKNLKGDDREIDDLKFPAFDVQFPSQPPPINVEQLTKAWGQLFVRDNAKKLPAILATAQQDAASLLLDTYEEIFDKKPLLLCSLEVPDLRSVHDKDYIEKRKLFQEAAQEQIKSFSKIFTRIANDKTPKPISADSLDVLEKNSNLWFDNLIDCFGKQAHAMRHLNFFLLEGCSLFSLFQKICREKDTDTPRTPHLSHGILATLTINSQ